MSVLNTNVVSTYELNASTASGQSTYRVIESDAKRVSARTILLFSKEANSNKTQLELSDPVDLGYKALAEDQEEVGIATQRRVNRGRFPGRRIAD